MAASSVAVEFVTLATRNRILVDSDGITTAPAELEDVTEPSAYTAAGHCVVRTVTA